MSDVALPIAGRWGTDVQLSLRTNTGMGGANQASVHIDGFVRDATVELDGRPPLTGGRLVDWP